MTDSQNNSDIEPKKSSRKRYGGWWFLAVVVIVYIGTAWFDLELALRSIGFFSSLLGKVAPVLLLVFGLIFLFNYFLNPQLIQKYLGQQSGLKGWLLAVVGGILSTGPVTAWYAMLSDLRQQGMSSSLAAVFLYGRAVKLPLLPLLGYYFGITYALVLCVYLISFAIINGILMKEICDE
jgi:uncharacterized membrane protein YraQ (UPF0718 family)